MTLPPRAASLDAVQLVTELEGLGVQLWEDKGRLHFRAPKGVMSDDRRTTMRELKQEVLEFLRATAGASVEPHPEARYQPFPLTRVQEAYLIGRGGAFPYGGIGCHAYGEVVMRDVEPPRLQRAWNVLVERHDMLRAVIEAGGSQQVLREVLPFQIAVADLRTAAPAEVQAQIEATRGELDHRVYAPGQWPLFDLRLTLAPDRAVLHLSIDFLIADYVSISLLLRELDQLYGEPDKQLPALPITFRDYQLAERPMRTGGRHERDRQYWWMRIDDLPAAPELPIVESAAGARKPTFRRHAALLPGDRWRRLQERAKARGITSSAAVLAAYAEVISCWAREPRFTLNLTLLQRFPLHPDVDRIVGDFTSVTLLAVDKSLARSFGEYAKALQAQLWEDLDHRLCSGIDVIREIVRRRGSEAGLMPIIFTSAIGLSSETADPRRQFSRLAYGISQTPQAWIDCQAMEQEGALQLTWDVRDGVFPGGIVENMFSCFAGLVDDIATKDETWDAVHPLKLPEAQAKRRAEVNLTFAPNTATLLHGGGVEQARKAPQRPAVISPQGILTYGELHARATALADRLRSRPGWDARVAAILMDTGCDQVLGVLATLLTGAAYLPVDPCYPAKRRDRILTDAGAGVVLTRSGIITDSLPPSIARIDVDDIAWETQGRPAAARQAAADQLAYVIYTSGSTGMPKGVMITHRSAANTIDDINRRFNVTADDRILGISGLAFDLSVYDIFGSLAAGACLVLPEHQRRNDPSHWLQLIGGHRVTVWNSVPAKMLMLLDLLDTQPSAGEIPLRLVLLSGDTITPTLAARLRERMPRAEVVSLGGATEASIWSIVYPIANVPPDLRRIPYGKPLRNQTFHVLDGALRPRPDWATGELYIGGEGLALGYVGDEALTAERFLRHPATGERLYRTGDLGRYLPDGNIEILGRSDSQVKLRGHRIELGEIEAVLQTHSAVANAAVVLHEEAPGVRQLAAFVEPRRRAPAVDGVSATGDIVMAAAETSAAALRAGVDCDRVALFAKQLDRTALLAMLHALRSQNLFANAEAGACLADILAGAQVAPRHHRLVRRWLNALELNGLLRHDRGSGHYYADLAVDAGALEEAWRRVEELQPEEDHRTELMDYFRLAARHLPELLRGVLDPVQLLFPEGRVEIHEVAYNDNFLSRYLNRIVCEAICAVARQLGGSIDLLEVGAGVGGTSIELIPALAKFNATYLFTDVSQFFLNNASERFRDYPWVRYGLFDLNRNFREQGLGSNSFDVVLCANVLHYSNDANAVIARMRELLRPGGWLVFIELVRDNCQILTSMEFLFDETVTEFTDVRKGRDATFIGLQEWHDILLAAGAEVSFSLPSHDDVLSEVGFHVVCAQFKSAWQRLTAGELDAHVREFLPTYMLPARIEILDRLPLTGSGKIDRRALQNRHAGQAAPARSPAGRKPATALEQGLAGIWASVLKRPDVGRDEDFFALGGDSLTAAQVVGRMREELPEASGLLFDVLLRLMLDGPNVAHVAAVIEEHRSKEAKRRGSGVAASPFISLRARTDGPLTVLVHDSGGTLASYKDLLRAAASTGADTTGVAGLIVADVETYLKLPPEVLVQRVAADYGQAMGSCRGRPVRLVGHGVGGLFALEVGRCLIEAGDEIAVTLIGSAPMRFLIEDALVAEYLMIRQAGMDPMRAGFPSEAAIGSAIEAVLRETPARIPDGSLMHLGGNPELDGVAWCFRRLAQRSREERIATFWRDLAAAGAEPQTLERLGSMPDVVLQTLTAAAMHDISPYVGDVTLVRPSQSTPLWPALDDAAISFWRERCLGSLDVVDVAGDHFTCLKPPLLAAMLDSLAPIRHGGMRDV